MAWSNGGEAELKRFEILGPVRAFDDDEEIALGPVKQRAVLAVLLLNANRPVSAAQIVTAVWQDEPPGNGANVVQKYIAGLRRVLEPERTLRAPWQLLTLSEAGYVLNVQPGALDSDVFHDRVRRAEAARVDGQLVSASMELHAALGLWRADALAGLTGPVFDAARDRLAEGRAAALESWAEIELSLGRHGTLVPELVRLVAEYPLREQLRHHLMLALYRTGRQAEALAAYRDARAFFVEEFGAEPGERLQQLHQRILRSDPSLAAPEDVPAGASQAAPTSPPPAPRIPAQPGPPPMPPPGPAGPVPLAATVPPFHARPKPPTRWWSWLWLAGAVAISACCFGYLTWLVVGVYAVQRRSLPNALAAIAYFVLSFVSAVTIFSDPNLDDVNAPLSDARAALFFSTALIPWIIGTLHAGLLGFLAATGSHHSYSEGRSRREQALQIVRWKPELARELLIGRPDLPRQFDDGGLVDINTVPGYVIAALPGVTPQHTEVIVADRTIRGPYFSVEDMVARQVITPKLAESLREYLVFGAPWPAPTVVDASLT